MDRIAEEQTALRHAATLVASATTLTAVFDGSFTVTSPTGAGTVVSAELPV